MVVDLHLHTDHSDGNWSPKEVVERAVELKLRHIAITDHDTMDGVAEAQAAAAGALEVIPGIEINTVWCGEDGFEEDVHILGYFLDKSDSTLKTLLERQKQARIRLVEETIEMLNGLGIHMSVDDVREYAGRGSIGRPHITQAIVKCGGAANVSEAYERFMVRTSPQYVKRQSVSPIEAIKAINAAGGISSIAHPGKSKRIQAVILALKRHGLEGIEVYHRRHTVDLVRSYIRFANRNGFAITGGSDCHGPHGEHKASIGSISVPLEVVTNLRTLRHNGRG